MELVLTFQRPDGAISLGGDPSGAKFSEGAEITGNASIFHLHWIAPFVSRPRCASPEEDFVVAHAALGAALTERMDTAFEPRRNTRWIGTT